MKKLILVMILFLILLLVGCGNKTTRFKVKVVEVYEDNDHYIVEKFGYTVNGIFYLETNDETLKIGDIVYVIILDNYNCRLFSEYMDELNQKTK